MILLDRNNQEVEVFSQFLLPNHTDTVYNIEVDDFHTYHVGRLGVWVHNANCCTVTRGILEKHYGKLDARYFGENGEIYWRNPLNNQMEQINAIIVKDGKQYIKNPLTGELTDATQVQIGVDHILPKNYFTRDSRFKQLPKEVQEELMNSSENLQLMFSSANSSKNSRIELEGKGWDTWKGQKVDSGYKDYLKKIQEEMKVKLENTYKKYNIK